MTELENKIRQGVTIKIITRFLEREGKNKRILKDLINYAKKLGVMNEVFSIYQYQYKGEYFNSSTFHAKSIVIDNGKKAYVGSANLTGWGLDEQLELGVLIEDKNARTIYEILKYLEEVNILDKIVV